MRKFLATLAAAAGVLAVGAPSAFAANTYSVDVARISPANSGTTTAPTPVRVEFGFSVGETTPGFRPAVTTDYDIFLGSGVRQNRHLFQACPLRLVSSNACPPGTKVGSGNINSIAGYKDQQGNNVAACTITMTLYNGDGRLFPPSSNDGRRVRTDLVLSLKAAASACGGVAIDAALPGQFVSRSGGVALQIHVPRVPFQEPLPGLENAVTRVTSNLFKTRRVRQRVRIGGVMRTVTRTRGYFETIRCVGRRRPVTVRFTPKAGATTTAVRNAPCTP